MVQYFITITTLHSSKSSTLSIAIIRYLGMTVIIIIIIITILLQAFTAFGPTLIQPTWFCSRALFEKVGPFSEQGKVLAIQNIAT